MTYAASRPPVRRRPWSTMIVVFGLLVGGLSALPPAAVADTVPPAGAPATVSADALPTVQIDGVVWSQVVIGTRVYATGSFGQARPAGAAPGIAQTPRANILAYDITTGALLTDWAPGLNAQGLALAASPDGSRVYVAGDFTTVNGQRRNRLAALDAATGALLPLNANANGRVRALAVHGDTVYAGGSFSTMGGVGRTRLAAVSGSSGALLGWNPGANGEVLALAAPPGSSKVAVGGRFTVLAGTSTVGLGTVDAVTGGSIPFPTNGIIRNSGSNAGIWSLSTDGPRIYGTGYTFHGGGNFEGVFAADTATGTLVHVAGCRGDTYSTFAAGPVLYNVSHHHDCRPIGGIPQTEPWTYQRASAFTTAAVGWNISGDFFGRPAPGLLHWAPTLAAGTVTGQKQGPWHVTGNDRYVVLGGEFPSVNGIAQQGLVRFALSSIAPNREGPQVASQLVPSVGVSGAQVRLNVRASYDRDNRTLTYEVLRGGAVTASARADSVWWTRPTVQLTDNGVPTGTHSYRVRAVDAFGNSATGPPVQVTVTNGATPPPPPVGTLASDTFERSVPTGWGTAPTGGSWVVSGSGATSDVGAGTGRLTVPPGRRATALLPGVSSSTTQLSHTVTLAAEPTGGGAYLGTILRSTAAGDYRVRLRWQVGGTVTAGVYRSSGGTDTLIGSAVTVPGTFAAGQRIEVRAQAVGVSPTTLRFAAWPAGTPTPADWQLTVTDSFAGLQSPGAVGVDAYASASATAAVVVTHDDVTAVVP